MTRGGAAVPSARTRLGAELAWTSWLHIWNDGLTAALAVLLPFIARDYHLDYAGAALVRTVHLLALSGGQVPLTAVAAGVGDAVTLGGALVWFGVSVALLSTAAWFWLLLAWGAMAGFGAAAYHPIATNRIAVLAGAQRRGRAIGALYFCGDVGKFALPAAAGLMAGAAGWRESLGILGAVGAASGAVYLGVHLRGRARGEAEAPAEDETGRLPAAPAFPASPPDGGPAASPFPAASSGGAPGTGPPGGSISGPDRAGQPGRSAGRRWGIRLPGQFALMALIGVLDQGLRSGVVTFLPFLLVARGFGRAEVGGLAALVFAGGALGKLAGGWFTDVVGRRAVIALAECLVAAGFVVLLHLTTGAALAVFLAAFGVVLNGTSSALYAGLAPVVDRARGSRGYGVFLTITFASTALSPAVLGVLADHRGLASVFWALAAVAVLIPPVALALPAGASE